MNTLFDCFCEPMRSMKAGGVVKTSLVFASVMVVLILVAPKAIEAQRPRARASRSGVRSFPLTAEMKGQLAEEMVKNNNFERACMDEAGGLDKIVDISALRLSPSHGHQYLLTGTVTDPLCTVGANKPYFWIYEWWDGNFRMLADIGPTIEVKVIGRRTNRYYDIEETGYLIGRGGRFTNHWKYDGTKYECSECGRD